MEENHRTRTVLSRIAVIALCVLIAALFVLIFLIPGYRPLLFRGMMLLGMLLNGLLFAVCLRCRKKACWLFAAGAAACAVLLVMKGWS